MPRHGVPLGRMFGIQIGLDYSWFVIFALITWMLATSYFPGEYKHWSTPVYWATGAATAVLFFGSVLLHELGHSVVALRFKVPVRKITLFIFGGLAEIGTEPPNAVAEFWIALAGPLVSLALAVIFYAVQPLMSGAEPLLGLARYLAYINMALLLFNLVPAYPLDGGRVFRAVVWAITGSISRSTVIAANLGRLFAFALILVGTWEMFRGDLGGGLWIALIGLFLDNAANAQLQQVTVRRLLAGRRVSSAMNTRSAAVQQDVTVQHLVDEHILGGGQRSVLVNRGESTVGMVTLHRIKEVPQSQWPTTTVAEVMLPLERLECVDADAEMWSALQKMDRDGVNQMPVVRAHRVVGMLSREDLVSFLLTLQELGGPPGATSGPGR